MVKDEKIKIAHVSDLHITGPNFVSQWGENVIDILNSEMPEILIITGDLTDDGYVHEYELAKTYIDRIKVKNKIVVPGNHDARNEGYIIFEEIFGTRCPYYENEKVVILGIDSSQPDIDDGHVGRENYGLHKRKIINKQQGKNTGHASSPYSYPWNRKGEKHTLRCRGCSKDLYGVGSKFCFFRP
ncbi:3',5'-cyclic adenosine monophosphate phosphodiesterase CpdA [Candidatus Methanoperedenaceae archaeon GB37]|nr:3',5'-cyclic adenosine monophosphate phosphodiesterase CpdA [Candidatus Methanoperedenaceae archaeon GB37]